MRLRLTGILLTLVFGLCVGSSACAGNKDVNTIVKNTADYGTTLIKGVGATAQAVAAAEASGAIPRDNARAVMTTLQGVTAKAKEAASYMDLLLKVQGTPEAGPVADKLVAALDVVNSELFKALVPIKDDVTRTQISGLAAEVSKTVLIINREIIGRIK